MSENYQSMWTELGLDLEKHDALLQVLAQAYNDIFTTQKNRTQTMSYFDFVMGEVHGLRIRELLDEKKAGRKIIGSYCVFVPEEIALAARAIGPYTDNGDGTVYDQATGLTWQQNPADVNGDNTITSDDYPTGDRATWEQALAYCEGLGNGWRLPCALCSRRTIGFC